jgi:hypothetical protein
MERDQVRIAADSAAEKNSSPSAERPATTPPSLLTRKKVWSSGEAEAKPFPAAARSVSRALLPNLTLPNSRCLLTVSFMNF